MHELEEIIEDVFKGKERMAKRDGKYRHFKRSDARRDDAYARSNRRDHEPDCRRDDYRNKPRVTLIEVSMDDLLAEFEGREAVLGGTEYSNVDQDTYDDDQDESSAILIEATLAIRHVPTRRTVVGACLGTFSGRAVLMFISRVVMGGRGLNQDQHDRRDFNRDNRRPQYVTCAVCGDMSHSAHYCNKRCKFCKQLHDAGKCELFRNFQDLAKFVRIKGTKEELPPELKAAVQERHLN
ncbi:hypothetical protein PInf_007113 [Phytophthora infestans]|nr:hypothetical protein PInf_007113 [Phytophthora infestans]